MKLGYLDDGGIKSRYLQDQVQKVALRAFALYPKLLNVNFITYGVDAKYIPALIFVIKIKISNLQNDRNYVIPYDANYCIQRLLSHKPISPDRNYFLKAKELNNLLDLLQRSN